MTRRGLPEAYVDQADAAESNRKKLEEKIQNQARALESLID